MGLLLGQVRLPSLRRPDLNVILDAEQHNLLLQCRQLNQLDRNANPPLCVQFDLLGRRKKQPRERANVLLGWRRPPQTFGQLAKRFLRVNGQRSVCRWGNVEHAARTALPAPRAAVSESPRETSRPSNVRMFQSEACPCSVRRSASHQKSPLSPTKPQRYPLLPKRQPGFSSGQQVTTSVRTKSQAQCRLPPIHFGANYVEKKRNRRARAARGSPRDLRTPESSESTRTLRCPALIRLSQPLCKGSTRSLSQQAFQKRLASAP